MSRRQRIEEKLTLECSPTYLLVEDESKNHHVPQNAQTHYKIVLASPIFNDLTRISRHRIINNLLKNEFDEGMHALSMHLFTPDEWKIQNQSVLNSPSCKDGYKNK